jgi:hypothetical protein
MIAGNTIGTHGMMGAGMIHAVAKFATNTSHAILGPSKTIKASAKPTGGYQIDIVPPGVTSNQNAEMCATTCRTT